MVHSRGGKRRISKETFVPVNQSCDELILAQSHPRAVTEILAPMMSAARLSTIDNVVAHRTTTLQVAVEGVHDPHNTAAIIRTAEAFGVLNVHIIEGETRFRSSAAVTQGAHKWVDVHVHRDVTQFAQTMNKQGVRILVAAMDGAHDVATVSCDAPVVLVFGNEADGISSSMFELADAAFKVPMFGFVESFNVSVAAAISIATLRRGGRGDLSSAQREVLRARYYLRSVRAGALIVRREMAAVPRR